MLSGKVRHWYNFRHTLSPTEPHLPQLPLNLCPTRHEYSHVLTSTIGHAYDCVILIVKGLVKVTLVTLLPFKTT